MEFPLPEAGHPASPAHPLLGCPVPSVPPAAEPIPHLQTPISEPQTVARACPQSAKPPSGSKSGLRTGSSCRHAVRSKAARRPSHPKQPRAQRPRPRRRRRRRTNGWVPVGAACEKAVYVLVSVSSSLMGAGGVIGHRSGYSVHFRDPSCCSQAPLPKSCTTLPGGFCLSFILSDLSLQLLIPVQSAFCPTLKWGSFGESEEELGQTQSWVMEQWGVEV